MSILSRLFGGSSAPSAAAEPEIHEGFNIFSEPMKDGSGYRVSARIEKEIDGELKSHHLIRADICESKDMADEVTIRKAKTLIDQMGDRLFTE